MASQRVGIGLGQRDLARGGRGLAFLKLQRSRRKTEDPAAERNRSRRHDQDLGALFRKADNIGDQRFQPLALQPAVVDEQCRADLDNDALIIGQPVGLAHYGCHPSSGLAGTSLASSSFSLSMARRIIRST